MPLHTLHKDGGVYFFMSEESAVGAILRGGLCFLDGKRVGWQLAENMSFIANHLISQQQ